MEKQYEELRHRLDGIDVTLKELNEGIKLLLASSQMNMSANGLGGPVDNKTQVVDDVIMTEGLNNAANNKRKQIDTMHGSDHIFEVPGAVGKTILNKEQSSITWKLGPYAASAFIDLLEKFKNSPGGIFSLDDVALFEARKSPEVPLLSLEGALERYKCFKNFDTVSDYLDHSFSSQRMRQDQKDWHDNLMNEWKDVKEQLPNDIFVRTYEGQPDLLRAVIIGPKGTPYHDGLFFFDVCIPSNYPNVPPLARYYSHGLRINPCVHMNGSIFMYLPNQKDGSLKLEGIWVPGTSNMIHFLVFLRNLFNATPLLNGVVHGNPNSFGGGTHVFFYNEGTFIRSVKTMVAIMNKPPKNFEDFVVGHFRNRAADILKACRAYSEGVQVGCLVNGVPLEGNMGTVSITFKNDLASSIKPLLDAFNKIGAEVGAEFNLPS